MIIIRLHISRPVLEPASNKLSSASSANNASLNSQDNGNYNNSIIPNNNRTWSYITSDFNESPNYNNGSNNYSDSSVDDILDQINDLTNELNNDINFNSMFDNT